MADGKAEDQKIAGLRVEFAEGSNHTTSLNLVDLVKAAKESVVEITGRLKDDARMEGLGSGFLVKQDGHEYVVTNNHVVKDLKGFEITTADGKHLVAEAVATDPKRDLAAFQLKDAAPAGMKDLALGTTTELYPGTELASLGFSDGKLTISPGKEKNKIMLRDVAPQVQNLSAGADLSHIMIDTNSNTQDGVSGGPTPRSQASGGGE